MSNIPNCPKCGKMMVSRTSKNGKSFFGCSAYPACDGTVWNNIYVKKEITKIAPPKNIKGSPQQESIWHAVQNAAYHVIVDALAGTGKTFTITYALQYIPTTLKVILIAFNSHIADELVARIPEGFDARTMNSFGNRQVNNAMRVRFNKDKLYNILETIVPQGEKHTQFLTSAVYELVNLCKFNLLDGKDDQLDDLVLKHSIEVNDSRNEIYSYVRNALKACKDMKGIIDYTDQLWFIYAFDLPVQQYDLFIGDEIQDWNPLQQFVMLKAISNGGRFLGVGDERQAIYAFAGADTNSIANLRAKLENTARGINTMPLSVTRRCPKSHVRFAQEIVSHIEALEDAKEGILESISLDKALTMINPGDLGICRRNAPLIAIAYKLIREGKTVIVKGRNIGEGLINLINKLRADDIGQLVDKAEEFRNKELDKLLKKGKKAESAIVALNDKIDTLLAFADNFDAVEPLKRAIESMFSDGNKANAIVLSSVHRAKGLESDTVYVFEFSRIRIPMVNEEFAQQEKNLDYIARTRSKNALYLVD